MKAETKSEQLLGLSLDSSERKSKTGTFGPDSDVLEVFKTNVEADAYLGTFLYFLLKAAALKVVVDKKSDDVLLEY